jgi:hypothetical protein
MLGPSTPVTRARPALAEWIFYTALLLLNRGEAEARIDRMYR